MKYFPIDVIHSNIEDYNPYHVKDGKWGGFGEQSWYVFPEVHPKNVWEIKRRYNNECTYYDWYRVWDNDKKTWRKITGEEISKIPEFKPRLHYKINIDDFAKIMTPIIKNMSNMILTELISVQPMRPL